ALPTVLHPEQLKMRVTWHLFATTKVSIFQISTKKILTGLHIFVALRIFFANFAYRQRLITACKPPPEPSQT
ncbi:MAG: hypothetical protein K2O20_03930, partial [Duncaniella sp.]|nr:hypothetical protein [Duncaniella sp.]